MQYEAQSTEKPVQLAEKPVLHFIERDTQARAECVRAGLAIGCHSELYADISEVMAYPPREGLIIARDLAVDGGIEMIIDRLLDAGVWLPVVAMDVSPRPAQIVAAIKHGALDFLVMPLKPERLAASIARLGKEAQEASVARQRLVQARQRLSRLSSREKEVLDHLSDGLSNKEMARNLEISPRTVEIHRSNMMTKLGARHAAEAIRLKLEARV